MGLFLLAVILCLVMYFNGDSGNKFDPYDPINPIVPDDPDESID